MKNNQLNVVHDDDLIKLLKSLSVYDSVVNGEHKCLFCDNVITLDNLESIVPHEGTIQFTCDATDCHAKLIGWK